MPMACQDLNWIYNRKYMTQNILSSSWVKTRVPGEKLIQAKLRKAYFSLNTQYNKTQQKDSVAMLSAI